MKRRDELTELRTKSTTQLVTDLNEAREKLLEARFALAFRKLKQTSQIRLLKKKIARLETLIREQLMKTVVTQTSDSQGEKHA